MPGTGEAMGDVRGMSADTTMMPMAMGGATAEKRAKGAIIKVRAPGGQDTEHLDCLGLGLV